MGRGRGRGKALVQAGLEEIEWTEEDLKAAKKSNGRKGLLAYLVRRDSAMPLDWIPERLSMGARRGVSRSAKEAGKQIEESRKLRGMVRRIEKKAIIDD